MTERNTLTWTLDEAATAPTLDALFRQRLAASPASEAYCHYDRTTGAWQSLTWKAIGQSVALWQNALAAEGLQPGERVAVALRNCPEWVIFDQAALALGLVVVPLYPDDRPDSLAYCLQDSGARLLLLQDGARWRRVSAALADLPSLQRIITLDEEESETDARVRHLSAWLTAPMVPPQRHLNAPGDFATLVYTSGTAGYPKGVMLSHENILSVTRSGLSVVKVTSDDMLLSFLPLSHMYERAVGYYLPMMAGTPVTFARCVNQLAEDLAQIKPSLLVTVPRLLERIHNRIEQQLAAGSWLSRLLFRSAVHCGWHHFEWQQRRCSWSPWLLLNPMLQRLVGRKVRNRFGGRLRLMVSGGAPLPFAIARTFIALGLPLLQGYGLSETSPQVSVNRPDDNDPHSVGTPLEGIETRIGAENELLVRGPCVMLGYWNNPGATATAIDGEGWFHTGDQASIINGHIYITGRLKDILVLSNGEKVPPARMESAITLDPLFEQALVIGEQRAYLTALVVLNEGQWQQLALECGVEPQSVASLHDRRVLRHALERIARQLHEFPSFARVRRVYLMLEPWTTENGLLTATLKVKRAAVAKRYCNEIAALYNERNC